MGCPPNPEEIEMGRNAATIRDTVERYNRIKNDFVRLFDFLRTISKKNLAQQQRELIELALELDVLAVNEPTDMDLYPNCQPEEFYSWLSEQGMCARENLKKIKRLETAMCNAGCFLYRFSKLFRCSDEKEAAELHFQIEAFKRHRIEDRQVWLDWLRTEKNNGDFWLESEGNDGRKEMAEYVRSVLEKEMTRVKNLSVEEMMLDCFAFGRNPEKFEFYTLFRSGKRT